MPRIVPVDTQQMYLFIPTIKYALYILGKYVTDLYISPNN